MHDLQRKIAFGLLSLIALLLMVMVVPRPAAAYIDPGSGALLWQALAAVGIGLLFYIRRIVGVFGRVFKNGRGPSNNGLTSRVGEEPPKSCSPDAS